ncbi:MAG: hypothetical protein KF898_02920 [Parachlamydiales bacterium]|nr:hypothetical protein [Verrucomicrobiota bacterium]MBX3718585.1 hypothetical protein [Candidatus Acheromyda pituitae]
MTSSIGGAGSVSPLPPEQSSQNVPALAQQMQTQVGQLIQNLSNLSTDQSQVNNSDFLSNMANNVSALNEIVNQSLNIK